MKKKIGLLLIFTLTIATALFFNRDRKVKAETETCQPKTNYYLLMEATSKNWYTTKFDEKNGEVSRTTIKNFALVVPKDATILKEGVVKISKSSTNGLSSMSLETFHNVFLNSEDNEPYSEDDGITNYIRAISWFDDNGTENNSSTPMPSDFDEWVARVPDVINKPSIKKYESDTSYPLEITRTWNEEDMENVTSGIVFSPAAYYIQYQECNGSVTVKYLDTDTEEEIMDSHLLDLDGKNDYSYTCPSSVGSEYVLDKSKETEFSGEVNGDIVLPCYYKKNTGYKVTVHFREKGTKNKIKDSTVILTDLADKASYEYTCKNDISLYDLDTKTKLVGEIDGENVDLYCDYTKKKMTLTVDYGTDYNCTDAGAIRKSESVDHVWGAKVDYTIPKIDGYEFSELGTSSKKIESGVKLNAKETAFSLTMPSKNASICLVYIKNSKTGSGLIYLAWIIGIGALAYSIYYFTRYFNNEEV